MEWKYTDFLVKKKFQPEQSVKVMRTVFWNMIGPITIDFLEKGATVNNISYCQLLRQNSPYLLNDPCIICGMNIKKCYKCHQTQEKGFGQKLY